MVLVVVTKVEAKVEMEKVTGELRKKGCFGTQFGPHPGAVPIVRGGGL
jgi:hypothetical protein